MTQNHSHDFEVVLAVHSSDVPHHDLVIVRPRCDGKDEQVRPNTRSSLYYKRNPRLTEEEVPLLLVEADDGHRLAAGSELPVGHVVSGVDQLDQPPLSTSCQDAAALGRGLASIGHQHCGPGQGEELLGTRTRSIKHLQRTRSDSDKHSSQFDTRTGANLAGNFVLLHHHSGLTVNHAERVSTTGSDQTASAICTCSRETQCVTHLAHHVKASGTLRYT